jgi:hypothetical protein
MFPGGRNGREISEGTESVLERESDGTGKTGQLTIKAASKELKISYRHGSLSNLWKGKSLLVEELPKSAQGQKAPGVA